MRQSDKRKWRALTQKISDFRIEAGWFANNRYDSGISVANVARIQNNGAVIHVTDKMRAWFAAQGTPLKKSTRNIVIPPRPFMTNAVSRVNSTEGDRAFIASLMSVFDGKITIEQAANQLALWLQSVLTEEFIKINEPALSGFTLMKRQEQGEKGTKPLQASGQMLTSIQSKAEKI